MAGVRGAGDFEKMTDAMNPLLPTDHHRWLLVATEGARPAGFRALLNQPFTLAELNQALTAAGLLADEAAGVG